MNRKRINSAQSIFFHPSLSNITRCQVPSRVRVWFHDSAGDIDFYPMSLSQSELTILHESKILINVTDLNENWVLVISIATHYHDTMININERFHTTEQ